MPGRCCPAVLPGRHSRCRRGGGSPGAGAGAGAAAALPGRGGAGAGAAMAEAERAALPPPAESSRDGAGAELPPGMERRPEPGEAAAAAAEEEEEEARPASPPFFLLYPGHGGGAAAAPPGLWRPPAPRGGAALPVLVLSYPGPDGAREYGGVSGAGSLPGGGAGRGFPCPERSGRPARLSQPGAPGLGSLPAGLGNKGAPGGRGCEPSRPSGSAKPAPQTAGAALGNPAGCAARGVEFGAGEPPLGFLLCRCPEQIRGEGTARSRPERLKCIAV